MLPWVLCLKLWWLVLPLSILGHPQSGRTHERRTLSEDLEPRDSVYSTIGNIADAVERRAAPPGNPSQLFSVDADGQPEWIRRLFAGEDPTNPVLQQLNKTDDLNATQVGYGFWKTVEERRPFDFYLPPDDLPFPRIHRGQYITVEGWVDDEVDEIQCIIYVMDHKIGYFDGNLDDGVIAIVNLGAAKGTIKIWRGKDDYVYLLADIHFPLRVHIRHTWRLFHLPHNPRDHASGTSNPTATTPLLPAPAPNSTVATA